MNLLRNKKGVLMFLLVGLAFLAGAVALVTIKPGIDTSLAGNYTVGKTQFALLNASFEANQLLRYADFSSRLALERAVSETGLSGGYNHLIDYPTIECGGDDYASWNNESGLTIPDYERVVSTAAETYLNQRLDLEPKLKRVVYALDFRFENNTWLGLADKPVEVGFEADNFNGSYQVFPHFKTTLPSGMGEFRDAALFAERAYSCSGVAAALCVQALADDFNNKNAPELELTCREGGKFAFELSTTDEYPVFSSPRLELSPFTLRFALELQ